MFQSIRKTATSVPTGKSHCMTDILSPHPANMDNNYLTTP